MRPSPSVPSLVVRRQPDRTVLRFTGCDALGECDGQFVSELLAHLPAGAANGFVVLDLGGIRYVTSTALGAFVGLNRQVRSAGGRLALANVGPAVRQVIATTRLDRLLEVLPAEGAAPGQDGEQPDPEDEVRKQRLPCRGGQAFTPRCLSRTGPSRLPIHRLAPHSTLQT